MLGILAIGLIKISVSFLYQHIFDKRSFRIVINVWIVILSLWVVAFLLATLLQCGKVRYLISKSPQDEVDHCGSAIPAGYGMVGSDVATDLITLVLPIPMVRLAGSSTCVQVTHCRCRFGASRCPLPGKLHWQRCSWLDFCKYQ